MVLGMALFTLVHVVLSLVGIFSGCVVAVGLLTAKRLAGWTAVFLASTVATSVTGFGFPFHGLTPAIVVGVISLVLLAFTIYGRYARHLFGAWRWIYVISAMIALCLNVLVLIVQLYEKVPALKALAPTQSEPPFVVTQLATMALFVGLTLVATIRFHDERVRAASPVSLPAR